MPQKQVHSGAQRDRSIPALLRYSITDSLPNPSFVRADPLRVCENISDSVPFG